jgi:TatD DNase family protein
MNLVDTHCHLQFDKYGSGQSAVYKRAIAAGVTQMLVAGTTLADSKRAIELAQSKTGVWAAAGVHPHEAEEFLEAKNSTDELTMLLTQPKVVAIGEIGLDYYKNYTPKEAQLRALFIGLNGIMTFTRDQAQLEAAKQVPKNRLVLETDAPFLTPAPKRDELCEPRHIKQVAEFLAELRGESLEELAEYSTNNAKKIFNLP